MDRSMPTTNKKAAIIAHMETSSGGHVCLTDQGAFCAGMTVKYTLSGERFTQNTGTLLAGMKKCMDIPEGSTDIFIEIMVETFIGVWTTVYSANWDETDTKCFKVTGTTFVPSCEEIGCDEAA